jgi:hypothetical protein
MGIKDRIEEAEILWQLGRKEGAWTLALVAAASAAGETGRRRGGATGVGRRKCRVFCLSVRHLLQSGHLPELPLEGRRDGRRHNVRTGAGIERQHLNSGVVHLGQCRHRELVIGDGASE